MPVSLDDLVEGTLVTPNIRLVRLLGRGGMGAVWIADHLTLMTQVAVKFISPELATKSPRMAQRFEREARLAARIKSPHAVQTYDHGITASGTPYIVMELLEGETLTARIQRHGTLTVRELQLVMGQAAEVLGRAHALGVVHRDIKPDNVFCIDTGYELFIKILDFGIAKDRTLPSASDMTSTGAMMGTPKYMSPEQVQSAKDTDSRADLWALAVTAYEALTGHVPFDGETLGALIIKIFHADFPLPSAARPDLGTSLDPWFRKALHPNVEQRYQSAREMADAFNMVLTNPGLDPVSVVTGASEASGQYRAAPVQQAGHSVAHTSPSTPPATDGVPAAVGVPAASAQASPAAVTPPPEALATPPGTFAGAASTMEPYVPPKSGPGKAVAIVALLVGLGAAAVVGKLVFGGDDATVAPETAAPAATALEEPNAAAPAQSALADDTAVADGTAQPVASATAEPTASASAVVATLPTAPPPPTKSPPVPTSKTTTTKTSPPKVDCTGDKALILVNGKLKVRPECR